MLTNSRSRVFPALAALLVPLLLLLACPEVHAQRIALARVKANGALDTTFSGDGKVITNLAGGVEAANAVVRDPRNGKFVVAGYSGTPAKFMLARYTTAGALDATFGTGGVVSTDFASCDSEQIDGMALGSSSLTVAGSCSRRSEARSYFALARYTLDGALMQSFDGDGKALPAWSFIESGYAKAVALSADGSVALAAGNVLTPQWWRAGVMAVNNQGALHTQFQGGGTSIDHNFLDARDVAFNPTDGRFYVAGQLSDTTAGTLAVKSSGNAVNYLFRADFASQYSGRAMAVAIDSSGKVIVAGKTLDFSSAEREWQFALARMGTGGALDTSFDGDGKVLTDFASCDQETIVDVVVASTGSSSGKIYACGFGYRVADQRLVALVARYLSDGRLDTAFDGDGKVIVDFGADALIASCTDDGAGGVVIAGQVN